jgi:alpha-L-fucosidase 2
VTGPRRARASGTRALVAAALALRVAGACAADDALVLRYDRPAEAWSEALPLGNGRLGAMVFGGTASERLQVNEATLWGGAPHATGDRPAPGTLERVRQLVFAGDTAAAESAAAGLLGEHRLLAPYQPFCDIHLVQAGHEAATDYRRELRLEDAVATVSYRVGDTTFRREAFVSQPDQVLVVELTADRPGSESLVVGVDSPQVGALVSSAADDQLHLQGRVPARSNPPGTWTASWDEPGMRFAAHLQVRTRGGSVHRVGQLLVIRDADAVTLLFAAATAFRNYHDIGGHPDRASRLAVARAAARSDAELARRHREDFSARFSRVRLRLGDPAAPQGPTDERLRHFAGTRDPQLVALYYQFARYLLLSASRPGGQAANLQGLWNQDLRPAWGSKWTTNINLQMNYWPADSGNLWEAERPLWDLVRDLRATGSATARALYGVDGWVLHHNTDLWRSTDPVDGVWGVWPVGAAWLANQMWDHYEFSQDREFLRSEAYPAMKGAALFALHALVPAPAGTPFADMLVTNPSVSPENQYMAGGHPAYLTYAPSMDIELLGELFAHCEAASLVLGVDAGLRARLAQARLRLPPLQVGSRGQLQEWIRDYPEAEPQHRHTSHLYGLYPGSSIDPEATPGLAAAARRSLELRGDGGTGWSRAWKVALWARLGDGEQAWANLQRLVGESTLPDLFNDGPPFQVDGNLGGAAGIAEMLLQSRHGEILLMPAVPAAWRNGSVAGLRARGGATVGFDWREGRLVRATVRASVAGTALVRYGGRATAITLRPGQVVTLDGALAPVAD